MTPPNLAIVMEFMPAGSLYDVLHVECRGLAAGQKSHMILDCWSAVAYLHERNVVHRDIKSMNILVISYVWWFKELGKKSFCLFQFLGVR